MRVIVTGGRRYNDRATVQRELAQLPQDAVIVHGAAPGADSLADARAGARGMPREPHPADWEGPCSPSCRPGHRRTRWDGTDYCPTKGHERNQEMADAGADLCLAFPGNRGTEDMVRRARKAGIEVREIKG